MLLIFLMRNLMKIIIATHNADKRKELVPLLDPHGWEILTLEDFPQIGEIVEDGSTLEENALIKARTVHQITGLPSLADDTGLEVEALNGAPGIYAARYAGENCSYQDNVEKLLLEMRDVADINRKARFRTVMAFVENSSEHTRDGFVDGVISKIPKGVGGFGYDPVFYVPDMNKTFAQMTTTEKAKISHRGRAMRNMVLLLSKLYANPQTSTTQKETA